MQVNRIMVPSELNRTSEVSLGYAVDLARQIDVNEIVLLNLIVSAHQQTSEVTGEEFDTTNQLINELNTAFVKKHLQLAEQQVREFSDNQVKILPIVKFNDSTADLNDFMQEYDANLLVCGSKDKLSFLEILLGSATEKMIRKLNYPMIVVKEEVPQANIRTIVLAVDLEEDDQWGIEEVIGFADALKARLELVYVRTNNNLSSNEAINGLQKLAKVSNMNNYSINVVDSQSIEDGLEGFVQKISPDMIAVISQGKGKLHKLIYGSSTEEIIKEAEVPVFVCKTN